MGDPCKVEEITLDDEIEDEVPLAFSYVGNGSARDPLGDPLQPEPDEDPDEDLTVVPASSSFSSYSSHSSSSSIHPFSLRLPRMTNVPPDFSLEWIEGTIRTFISNSLSSRKDPRCRHQFYLTIHTHLNEALHRSIISPGEVDSLWKKFDQWAASTSSYRLGDHYLLQYRNRANDPDQDPPPPKRCTRHKKSLMVHNLEKSVRDFVLNSRELPLLDDLHSRVQFYQSWHKYWSPGSELFLDHFWNALVNRTPSYYQTRPTLPTRNILALPPAPRKVKEPAPKRITSASSVPKRIASGPKSLDMDRLVKLCINSLLHAGKDPRASHRFYWTVHRCLETVSSLNMSPDAIDQLWRKYDIWADMSYRQGSSYEVPLDPNLYSDVSELPPPTKTIARRCPRELETPYPQGLKMLLQNTLKTFIVGGKVEVNSLRDNLRKRRLFLESYVFWVRPEWEERLLDSFWARLLSDHVGMDMYTKYVSPVDIQLPTKFDMDRLIKICINKLVESGRDPRTTHRFYWTIHRSLETVSSLKLSKQEVDQLWSKYDGWAKQVLSTGTPLSVTNPESVEYFKDVMELPGAVRKYSLSRRRSLDKQLEKAVRDIVIRRAEAVNTILDDLAARRQFFGMYADFVNNKELETEWQLDLFWGRLLRETKEDYQLYLELGKVVGEHLETMGLSGSKESNTKALNMDYLVKTVVNECLEKGKDPRLTHRYYWTVHRCLEEAKRDCAMSPTQVDGIWGQYDDIAGRAWQSKAKYPLVQLADNYYKSLAELPKMPPQKLEGPTVTQLYPSCPKSTALKRFLEAKVKQLVNSSSGSSDNGSMGDWRVRRKFFLEYLPHVAEVVEVDKMMDGYWSKVEGKRGPSKEKEVPCIVLD